MQGLITLDFGNSNPHAGLFQKSTGNWELLKTVPWKELEIYLNQFGMNPDNSQFVLCEVRAREDELLPYQNQGYLITRVREYWRGEKFAGMPVNYARTLGEDRLIEAHYCYKKDKTPTMIIDAGTYVTMDIVNEQGFVGGYIVPGIEAYFSAFSQGDQLKEFKLTANLSSDLPHATMEAMRDSYSAFGSFARETIKSQNIQKVILTGGAASLWESFFTGPVQIEKHLIHWAIQHWMTTQIELS
ncbi:MAG TPA: type III pantothenate kinase [Bacteriovoracaceae bacterium]|nr:type III pantothenate kinase [Bacteriovoracaceae bacterium]